MADVRLVRTHRRRPMEVPAWVTEKYGNVQIHEDERSPFKVVDFVERVGTLALGIYVSDAQGAPIQNVAVVFEWPGAPPLQSEAGWVGRGIIEFTNEGGYAAVIMGCLLYTSPSPRDGLLSRMPSSA